MTKRTIWKQDEETGFLTPIVEGTSNIEVVEVKPTLQDYFDDAYFGFQYQHVAALARSEEREACAVACEEIDDRCPECAAHNDHEQCILPQKENYARVIRERSKE